MPERDTFAMTLLRPLLRHCWHLAYTLLMLLIDGARYLWLCLRPSPALAAENLFLRKQLALYQERHVTPRRATDATRLALLWLGRWFDWRQALAVVQPATFLRWHRQGFHLFWRWKSTPGRPPLPADLQALIRRMAHENPTWGQERIANGLLLKLGLQVSPRTVRKYMPCSLERGPGTRVSSQRWATFVRNHAQAIVACDFCVAVPVTFRLLSKSFLPKGVRATFAVVGVVGVSVFVSISTSCVPVDAPWHKGSRWGGWASKQVSSRT